MNSTKNSVSYKKENAGSNSCLFKQPLIKTVRYLINCNLHIISLIPRHNKCEVIIYDTNQTN